MTPATNIHSTQHGPLHRFSLPQLPVWHGFFSRQGGYSAPPYSSFNTAYRTDDPQAANNRTLLLETMGLATQPLRILSPSHQDRIVFVEEADWQQQPVEVLLATDAALTRSAHGYFLLGTADCIPLIMTDQAASFVGLVHLGWRNLVDNLAAKVVQAIDQHYGIPAATLMVGLGPAIHPCCYRFADPIQRQQAFWQPYLQQQADGRYSIDLPQALQQQLRDIGIPQAHIGQIPYCTACHPELFFSCYQEGYQSGRFPTVTGRFQP